MITIQIADPIILPMAKLEGRRVITHWVWRLALTTYLDRLRAQKMRHFYRIGIQCAVDIISTPDDYHRKLMKQMDPSHAKLMKMPMRIARSE